MLVLIYLTLVHHVFALTTDRPSKDTFINSAVISTKFRKVDKGSLVDGSILGRQHRIGTTTGLCANLCALDDACFSFSRVGQDSNSARDMYCELRSSSNDTYKTPEMSDVQTYIKDSCPQGFEWLYENTCVKYVSTPLTWSAAQTECNALGAHLLFVTSLHKQQVLMNWFIYYYPSPEGIFIGGRRSEDNYYEWIWYTSDTFDPNDLQMTFTFWESEEPNNGADGGESCVEILTDTTEGRWNDKRCSEQRAYLCQYDF